MLSLREGKPQGKLYLQRPAGSIPLAQDISKENVSAQALDRRPHHPHRTSNFQAKFLRIIPKVTRFSAVPLLFILDLVSAALPGLLFNPNPKDGVAFVSIYLMLTGSQGLLRSRLSLSAADDFPGIAGCAMVAAAIVTTVHVVFGNTLADGLVLVAAIGTVILGITMRAAGYAVIRTLRRRRLILQPALIFGAGQVGNDLARILIEHPEYGLQPVGFLDNNPAELQSLRLPLLGGREDLIDIISRHQIASVLVAFTRQDGAHLIDIIRTCDRLNCEILFVPRFFELYNIHRSMDEIWGFPLVRLRRPTFRSLSWKFKRVLDIFMAISAVILASPLLVLSALASRIETGQNIIFRQERVGIDGRKFEVLKFRTLRVGDGVELATPWNVRGDPRIGPLGRLLRRSSLDELPQLFNVLRGEMSLVGPRPERPYFVTQFTGLLPHYMARHRVPCGLTGWAQIHGLRGDTSISDRARFDNYYIENWSLILDLKILVRTVFAMGKGSG